MSDMSVDAVMEKAISILLENGFKSPSYRHMSSWKDAYNYEYSGDFDEEWDDQYSLYEIEGVWYVIDNHVRKNIPVHSADGFEAEYVANEYTYGFTDRETHYVVLRLTQGAVTRYVMREGFYSSYGDSSLGEHGKNKEVTPEQKTITVWN